MTGWCVRCFKTPWWFNLQGSNVRHAVPKRRASTIQRRGAVPHKDRKLSYSTTKAWKRVTWTTLLRTSSHYDPSKRRNYSPNNSGISSTSAAMRTSNLVGIRAFSPNIRIALWSSSRAAGDIPYVTVSTPSAAYSCIMPRIQYRHNNFRSRLEHFIRWRRQDKHFMIAGYTTIIVTVVLSLLVVYIWTESLYRPTYTMYEYINLPSKG